MDKPVTDPLNRCPVCQYCWSDAEWEAPATCPSCGVGFKGHAADMLEVLTHKPAPEEFWLCQQAQTLLLNLQQQIPVNATPVHIEMSRVAIEATMRRLAKEVQLDWPTRLEFVTLEWRDPRLANAWDRDPRTGRTERNAMLAHYSEVRHRESGAEHTSIVVPEKDGEVCGMTCIGALLLGWQPGAAES